jgi:O-antigen/teichoic acid export membrane protein
MSNNVRRSIVIYACAFAVVGVTPFLLLPILTKRLSPSQFGEVTSFLVLSALLANLAGLSTHGFVSVRFFKSTSVQFKALVSSSIAALGVIHTAAAVIVTLLFPVLAQAFGLPLVYTLLAVLAALFLNLNLVFLAIFQSSNKPLLYLRARLVQGLLEYTLCMGLIFMVAADAGSRIYSYVVAISASALVGLYYCKRNGQVGDAVDQANLKALVTFGVPMLPHIVAGTAITYMDRLFVSSLLGTESLGIYMVAMQVGMGMIALIEPLNKALAPWLFERLSKGAPEVRHMIVLRTYQLYIALAIMGVLVASVAHIFFDTFVGEKFTAARSLIPWMVAGYVLQGMYYSVVNYMFYAERTGLLSLVTGTTAAVGCAISYTLTSAFGLQGAAASFLLNNILMFVLVWAVAAQAVPMPWRLGR